MKTVPAMLVCVVALVGSAVALRASSQPISVASLLRADAAYRARQFVVAAREYSHVIDADPANGTAHTGLVRALLKLDKVVEAARAAERACFCRPSDATLLATAGDVWFRRGDFARAEQTYRAAVAANPTCARGHWGLGRIDLIERRNRSARQRFVTAYRIDPHDADIVLDWARTLPVAAARVEAIERYLTLAANEDPAMLAGIRARAAALKALGEDEPFVVADAHHPYRLELREALGPNGPLHAYRVFATVRGQKLRLTLDTAASGIHLNRKVAARLGLVPVAETAPMKGVGDEGAQRGFLAIADALEIGDVRMTRCEIAVASGEPFGDSDGVIGTDVFSHFLVKVDFPRRTVDLIPPEAGEESIAGDFWSVERHPRAGFTPVHVFGHLLLADASVNSVPGFLLALDSGAPVQVLSTAAAGRVTRLHLGTASVWGVSGQVRDTLTTGHVTLRVGPLEQPGSVLAVDLDDQSRRAGTEISGLIGLDALRRCILTIDYTNGLVRLEPTGNR